MRKEREKNVHFDLSPNSQPIIQDSPEPPSQSSVPEREAVKEQGTIKSREIISNADREDRIARY